LLKAALKAIALNQIQCTSNATTITHHEGVWTHNVSGDRHSLHR
jgi:hypothetical protein